LTLILALIQGRLRDQVEHLNERMMNRGVLGTGSEFDDTAGSLQQAAVEMGAAVKELEAEDLDDALAPEQRALQHLQRPRPRSGMSRWPSGSRVGEGARAP
jgi:hypothetical protein